MIRAGVTDQGGVYRPYTLEELHKLAAIRHCELVVAGPTEILLDLDRRGLTVDTWALANSTVIQLIKTNICDLTLVDSWKSRNGGLHVRLSVGEVELNRPTLIALQSILGSDPKREALAIWEWRENGPGGEDTRSLFRPLEL